MTNARTAADAFADAVGEDRSKVRLVDPHWRDLLTACCRVEVHCTGWPAKTTLTLDDLGIHADSDEEAAANAAVLVLGDRLLLPKPIVQEAVSLRNQFRQALWKRSIPSHWGALVPQHRYVEWKAEAARIKAEYRVFAERVYDTWDDLEQQVRQDYVVVGRQNYRRLVAAGRAPGETETEWVSQFVHRCMAKMETRDYWLNSMRMWWDDPSYIPLNSMLAEDEAEAAHVAAIAQAKTEMERDVLKGAAHQFELGLFQFMSDVRGELTSLIFNVVADCLTAADKNSGSLPRNSSKQLKNLVEKVEGLQFWDDATLTKQMSDITSMMDVPSGKRSAKEVQTVLQGIGAEARLLLIELDRPIERRSRHLGIPETEEALKEIVRQPRNVVISEEDAPVVVRRQPRRLTVVAA
jgi:hypothetical protein